MKYIKELSNRPWHEKGYMYVLYLAYILFAIGLSGIIKINPIYLKTIDSLLKYYISIFLIIKFNPYFGNQPRSKNAAFDRTISYSAGIFLLLTTAITGVIEEYLNNARKYVFSVL